MFDADNLVSGLEPPFPPCTHCGGWGQHEAFSEQPCPKCGNHRVVIGENKEGLKTILQNKTDLRHGYEIAINLLKVALVEYEKVWPTYCVHFEDAIRCLENVDPLHWQNE